MDVTKAPPLDAPANRGSAAPTSQQSAASLSRGTTIPPVADRVDIQPLDVTAALQILIAEVRTALELPADSSMMQSPAQASRALIQMFLHAVPDEAHGVPDETRGVPDEAHAVDQAHAVPDEAGKLLSWAAASTRIELAFQTAIDGAVHAVAAWRDVPQVVVDAAKETRTLVVSQLNEQPLSPVWLRPEWLGLAPKFERFWRRRRCTRRGLTDPDLRAFREADESDSDKLMEEKSP